MSDPIRVDLTVSEIGVRPEHGDFEQRCLDVASSRVAEQVSGWADGVRVVDIDVDGDSVVVMLGERVVARPEPLGFIEAPDDDGDDVPCDCGHEHVASSDDGPRVIPVEDSAAWDGPLRDAEFGFDIIDICCLLDLMGFAQQLAQATGAITPTIQRSITKLETKLAVAIGEDDGRGGTRPSDAFLEHMNAWMRESAGIFGRIANDQKRRVVRAQTVVGPNFDPRGGMGGPGGPVQGPPPLHMG